MNLHNVLIQCHTTVCFACVYEQSLKDMESEKLQVQIQAYLDNVFDVGALLEDAENKGDIVDLVADLQENNAQVKYAVQNAHNHPLHDILYVLHNVDNVGCTVTQKSLMYVFLCCS